MDEKTRRACEAILPPGLCLQTGNPPAAPSTFAEGYVLPQHFVKPLQRAAPHPLDSQLAFFEVPHIYTWKKVPTSVSVTGLAHEFEKAFDPDSAIRLMKTSRSQAWPRADYVLERAPLTEWTPARGALLTCHGKTIAVVHPHSTDETTSPARHVQTLLSAAIIRGQAAQVDDEDTEAFSYTREMSSDEIKAAWAHKGMMTSHMGTEAHFQAELMFNGLPFRFWEPESRVLIDFVESFLVPRGIVASATEKEIVCVDADVAGSIDAIVYDPKKKVHHLIDHKRTDKLAQNLRGFGNMLPPLSHLDDCKGAAYALQLSLYQKILERDYGFVIGDRILLSLHPDAPFSTSVPYLKDEVEFIMERRFALVRARKAAAAGEPRFRCSLTGAPAVDAVFLTEREGSAVAMEKAAILAGEAHTRADSLRLEFEAEVQKLLDPVEFKPATGRVSWCKQMPAQGIPPFSRTN